MEELHVTAKGDVASSLKIVYFMEINLQLLWVNGCIKFFNLPKLNETRN